MVHGTMIKELLHGGFRFLLGCPLRTLILVAIVGVYDKELCI